MEKNTNHSSSSSQQPPPPPLNSIATTNSQAYRNTRYSPDQSHRSYPQQQQQSHRSYPQQQQQLSHRSYPQQQQQQSHRSYPQQQQQQQSHRSYPQQQQQQQSHRSYPQQQQSHRSYPQQQQQQSHRSYPQQQQQQQQQQQRHRSYPQQSNRSYPQREGAYESRDAPPQRISSFRNNSMNTNNRDQILNANYADKEKVTRENRLKRFENSYSRPKTAEARLSSTNQDGNATLVKGTCQQVEKCYLRLSSSPHPSTVRPEQVLEKALLMVMKSQKNYLYKCDQFKSIRQDLTVQRIRNELTVKVYETHARLAIEVGDLSEYNQCQSQLQELYAEGHKGCDMEFSAYNLLSVILHSNNNRDLLSAMSRLSVDARKDKAVKHALAVRAAVTSGNYVLFFRLYKEAPNLSTFLMDLYVEKMRYTAVKCISRSYRPTLPVAYIAQLLGFSSVLLPDEPSDEKDTDGLEECAEWLKAHGACLLMDNTGNVLLDSKASTSSLFMPKLEVDVAHGDATLSVNDFLIRAPS